MSKSGKKPLNVVLKELLKKFRRSASEAERGGCASALLLSLTRS